jgi:hypothetical protein
MEHVKPVAEIDPSQSPATRVYWLHLQESKEMMKKAALIVWVLAAIAVVTRAQSSPPPLRWNRSCAERAFVVFTVLGDGLKGDLDGKLALGTTEKVFYVPKVSRGPGFSVSYGQTRKSGLWTVGFSRTVHGASFRGVKSTAYSNAIEVSGKGYLWTRAAILPYIQLGFELPWLHVTNAAERGGVIYDANYLGLGVQAGAGLLIPLNDRIFVTCGGSYRFLALMYAKGPGRGRDVTNLNIDRTGPRRDIFLRVPGFRLEIGLSYIF